MSDHEPNLNDDLQRVERRLLGWAPSAPNIDRDRLIFEAGRSSARSKFKQAFWPLATAAAVLAAIGSAWGWSREHSRRQDLEMVLERSRPAHPALLAMDLPATIAPRDPGPIDPYSYAALTRRLTESGDLIDPPTLDVPIGRHPVADEPIPTPYRVRSKPGRFDL